MARARWPTSPPAPIPAPKERFAPGVVWFGLGFLTVFTVAMTIGFFVTQTEPGTLITAVYAFWGAELCGLLVKRIADKMKRDGAKNEGSEEQ